MQKLQTQGLHHVTLVGADRQTSIDFWEGVLGMPFVFEQPNLDNPGESHVYFDPGDGRLITVFTREDRKPIQRRTPTETGCVHHMAFNVSRAVFMQAVERLGARGIPNTGVRDRMIFDAIYFEDPLGLLIELSCWKFDAPARFYPGRRSVRRPQSAGRARRPGDRRGSHCRRDREPRKVVDEEPVRGPSPRKTPTGVPRRRTSNRSQGGNPCPRSSCTSSSRA